MEDIAAAVSFSASECCRMFRRVTGETIFSYLNSYRLEQGAVLLRSTAPRRAHCASIAVMVGAENHGVGIGSALLKRLLDEADRELCLHRLELLVLADNSAAISLYRKNGFSIEARRRHAAVRNGDFADEFMMARISAEAGA